MSELPESWVEVSIGEIAEIRLGKMLDRDKNQGDPVAYLRNINVRWGSFDLSDVLEMKMTGPEQSSLDVRQGDIMVCEGGEPGRAAVWEGGLNSLSFQKAILRLRPLQGVSPHLVAAYLRKASQDGELEKHFTGTTIKHLPQQALSRVPIRLAPLPEQRRIVAKIDSLSGKSKRARDHLNHIPRLIEKYKQVVLGAAFRGDLTRGWRVGKNLRVSKDDLKSLRATALQFLQSGRSRGRDIAADKIAWQPTFDLPSGWVWASVDQVTSLIQYGSSAKTSDGAAGVAVLRMGNIQNGKLELRSLKYLPDDHEEFPELVLEPGDVLFNRTNSAELVGKTAVYTGNPERASFASYLIRLRCCGLLPALLSGYINSVYGRDWVATVVNQQVGQANVNGSKLRQLGVPIMPEAEQREIVRRLEHAFSWIDRLATEATSARKLLDRLDQAILAKAFQGELVARDPNDEPASALLDRIKAERAAGSEKVQRRRRAGTTG